MTGQFGGEQIFHLQLGLRQLNSRGVALDGADQLANRRPPQWRRRDASSSLFPVEIVQQRPTIPRTRSCIEPHNNVVCFNHLAVLDVERILVLLQSERFVARQAGSSVAMMLSFVFDWMLFICYPIGRAKSAWQSRPHA